MRETKNFGIPYDFAIIRGNDIDQKMEGILYVYPYLNGSIIELEVTNMPISFYPFSVHIYDNKNCTEENLKDFQMNQNTSNPFTYMGVLPSIFSNNGYGYFVTYTNRFKPENVFDKIIVIHDAIDESKINVVGNNTKAIACGEIKHYIP